MIFQDSWARFAIAWIDWVTMSDTVVEIRHYSGVVETHRHDYHQVILPYSGSLEIEVNHCAGRVTENIASFVPAGSDHSFLAQPENAFIVLDVAQKRASKHMARVAMPPFFAIGADIRGLIDYLRAGDPQSMSSQSVLEAWSILVLDRLDRHSCAADRAENAVDQALAFMRHKLTEPIRNSDIAKEVGMSTTRLYDVFLKCLATTPHAKLIALRLDAAERLLCDPRLSIAEVAVRSGHADQSTLTRIMQRERGVTPAAVRKSLVQSLKERPKFL